MAKFDLSSYTLKDNFLIKAPGPKIKLFSFSQLDEFEKNIEVTCSDEDVKRRSVAVVKLLKKSGEYRQLKDVPVDFRGKLARLAQQFPNFSEVIEYIGTACEIAVRGDFVIKLAAPILLVGPPGIGKTFFAEELAKFFGSGFESVRYDSAQSGSEMSGSSVFWSNCAPGKPFIHLAQSVREDGELSYANPLFFLDELDKSSTGPYDPLGPLYGLLDRSAKIFKDLCYSVPIDASHIMYVCACNDVEKLPTALISRFREFEISVSASQAELIAESIASSLIKELLPATENMVLDREIFKILSKHSPRKVRQLLLEAIGRAFARNSSKVIGEDISSMKTSPRIGFI